MKKNSSRPKVTRFISLVLVLGGAICAVAQGNLTPPGAPAATMKTLQQIEPRTPISSLPFVITNSGSYYLTTNLYAAAGQNGITIQTNSVTLDLGGFVLDGAATGLTGVLVSGERQSIALFNGTIRGWSVAGVDASPGRQVHCSALRMAGNLGEGLLVGTDSLVESCTAFNNTGTGIAAVNQSRIVGCVADANGMGIRASGWGNRIEDNSAGTNTLTGFRLDGGQNLLVRNLARYNGTNYNVGSQNSYGQILINAYGIITNNNPWLNFEFRTCAAEVCNGLDDDCNGVVDNGNPGGGGACATGNLGVCAAGTLACTNGAVACVQNVQPSAEICNGLDDNCNGVVDEGNPGGGFACSTGQLGVCAAGTSACVGGSILCNRNVNPSTEVCNGLDDNCDGVVDNGATCPGGFTCTGGSCVANPTCVDAIKNGTETDVDCGGATCPKCGNGKSCLAGTDCTSGNCSGGVCVALSNGTACTTASQCASGNCVDGVCCNTACGGTCQACNLVGSVGTCGNIPNGQDPASECAGSTTCNGSGACALFANGSACSLNAECGSGFCVDGVCCNVACNGVCQACTAAKKGSGSNGTCGNIAVNTDPDNECSGGLGLCNGSGACY